MRFFILKAHYRSPLNFSQKNLDESSFTAKEPSADEALFDTNIGPEVSDKLDPFPSVNTSFNENEPIVMKPEESIDCLLRTDMDAVFINNFFVSKI